MPVFDEVREHLEASLAGSPDEVLSYLERWLRAGIPLRLMLGSGYVNYPSLAELPGRYEESGLPVPWRFRSPEAAARFCTLVEEAFAAAGGRCVVER